MTVGKLKEYLNDIDDNIEIKGLILHCENGYSIQSKMAWIENDGITELKGNNNVVKSNV